MPVWLGEGLAEYFSTYRLMTDGRRAEAGHPIAGHILLLRERFVPVLDLLDTTHTSKLYNEDDRRTIFYAESWALTHYILSQLPNGREAINTYVTRVNAGASQVEAVHAAFGMMPTELERQLRPYVQRAIFSMIRYELPSRVVVAKAAPPLTLSPAEAEAWLGDLQRAVRGEAAAARIEAAAAKAPDTAIAQLALGRLRAQQDRGVDARAALGRAAALAPNDFMTQLAHGLWLARAGGRLVQDEEVVASLRRATVLNPESPEAHAWLAVNLMLSPATLGEAKTAIERAMQLAPGRLDYVLHLADIYLSDDLFAPARSLLTAVAAVKSDERASAAATSRLASIAKREEALARMAAARAEHPAPTTLPRPPDTAGGERTAGASPAVSSGGSAAADPLGANSVDLTDVPSVYAPTRLAHSTSGERLTLMLRRPKPDEERVFATLTNIECLPGPEIRFHVADGARTVVAAAPRFSDVELTGFKPEFMVTCGRRSRPDPVAFTWRPAQPGHEIAGTAIAIEFLPDGYGPLGSSLRQ
jgi:tetratricopeptide (TPR) repeat protein